MKSKRRLLALLTALVMVMSMVMDGRIMPAIAEETEMAEGMGEAAPAVELLSGETAPEPEASAREQAAGPAGQALEPEANDPSPEVSEPVTELRTEVSEPVTELRTEASESAAEEKTEAFEPVTEPKMEGSEPVTEEKAEGSEPVTEEKMEGSEPATEEKTEAFEPVTEERREGAELETEPKAEAAGQETDNAGAASGSGTEESTEAAVTGQETEQGTEVSGTEEASESETEPASEENEPKLVEQALTASGSGEDTVTLTGVMPEDARAEAKPVRVEIEGQKVLAAYDITIYDGKNQVYQPEEGTIQVTIVNAAVKEALDQAGDLSVYHMEDTAAVPQEIREVTTTAAEVVFDAESFSIYVVTVPVTHFTHTYTFYDGDTVLNQQILSTGETLQTPESPTIEHKVFLGWYTEQTDGTKFTRFGVAEGELTENRITELYARYETAYYVFYKAGNEEDSRVLFTQKYSQGAAIITEDVPFNTGDVNKALTGWSKTRGANEPDTDLTVEKEDVTLYPVVKEARWITYDSQGGSSVPPAFVLTGEHTKEPENPQRVGYAFDGWYSDTDYAQPFRFGETLSDNVTLYAKWIPQNVTYTVVYWQQNPDDEGYSFESSESRSGMTGQATNVEPSARKYEGFSLSTSKPVLQQTIAGDGSTVVNVYYDRNIYQVKFYKQENMGGSYNPKYQWVEIEELTISAKFGQDIANRWPSRRTDVSMTYPSNWRTSENGTVQQSGIGSMPLGGTSFYMIKGEGNYTIRTEFYLQNIENDDYTWDHADDFKSTYTGWRTTVNDYYEIKGFTVNRTKSDGVGDYAKQLAEGVYGWQFYYDRNTYKIEFWNGDTKDSEAFYKYEADISGAGYIPAEPPAGKEGYLFAGWYENELLLGEPYDFTGRTMPANNMILYAKWTAPVYTVIFDLNGAEAGGTMYDPQLVEKDGTVKRPEDPVREGYKFAGWTKNGEPFNFDTRITENTTLTAQWISDNRYKIIYVNGGQAGEEPEDGNIYLDGNTYVDGAEAKISVVPGDWKAPDKREGFICWNTEADGSGTDYYPGDTYTMPAHDVILYAKWALCRKTTLTYDYNGGHDGASNERVTEEIDIPNEEYSIQKDGTEISRPGYAFIGWTTDKEGNGTLLNQGDKIQVDTLHSETNVLYAQWRRFITVTVKKQVSGNMADLAGEFNFTYKVTSPNGGAMKTGSLTVRAGGSAAIPELEPGSTVTITEASSSAQAGYKVQVEIEGKEGKSDSNSCEIPNIQENTTVLFTNTREVVPPTGLPDNGAPLTAMVLLSLAGLTGLFLLRRRDRQLL